LFLTVMSGLFAKTSLSVCTPWFKNTVIHSFSVTDLGMWEYQFLLFQILIYCILSSADVYIHYHVVLCIHSLPVAHRDVRWSIVSSYSLHSRHLLSISVFKILLLLLSYHLDHRNHHILLTLNCISLHMRKSAWCSFSH
jgi:hypothetical protein